MEFKLAGINTKYNDGEISTVEVRFSEYVNTQNVDMTIELSKEDGNLNNMNPPDYEKAALEKVKAWVTKALENQSTTI